MSIDTTIGTGRRSGKVFVVAVAAVLAVFAGRLSAPGVSSAAVASPGWYVDDVHAHPTNLPPGGTGNIEIDLYNVGASASSGQITLTDVLPAGLTATSAFSTDGNGEEANHLWECSGAQVVICTIDPQKLPAVGPGSLQRFVIAVKVTASPGTLTNSVTVAGGGAPTPASVSTPIAVAASSPGFGLETFNGWISSPDGTTDEQAGSHPYELAVAFDFNHFAGNPEVARDIEVAAPSGLIGDPTVVPQCTRQQLDDEACPPSTQIGIDRFDAIEDGEGPKVPYVDIVPLYNMVPPPGIPAQFALDIVGVHTFLDASVRSGGDYGITEHADDLPQKYRVTTNTTILWGVPADPSHDFQRGACLIHNFEIEAGKSHAQLERCPTSATIKPFLTMPTSCGQPPTFMLAASSWQSPETLVRDSFTMHNSGGLPIGFGGCDHLGFDPGLSIAPDTTSADTLAGLTVEVKTPQEGLLQTEGLAISNIADTTVALPEGVAVNPGQAAGLQACGSSEAELTTASESEHGEENAEPAKCPNASRVGTDQIETPLLAKPLQGNVYVLQSNPPHLQLLVTAEGEGVFLKLVGNVQLDERTGRLTSTFANTPELPFTVFKLAFSGGAQAALSTPAQCGIYTATSDFTPWSSPFVQDVFPSSAFAVEHGTNGAPCPSSPLPFALSMIAGSTTDQAGGFTDFSLLLTRPDDQQRVSGLRFKTPEGLLGMISKIPLCPEAQANAGTCSSASQIGHTVVEAGPGPYPLVVPQPGQPPAPIYLTGPYKGAPYGLSIVVPLVVGPFTLQTQIVRAKIEVDPLTAQITVVTDLLPQIIDGVPADLRTINAVIDKPGFMFNPTDCSPQSFSGIATSNEGAQTPISSHFQMGSCQSLKFDPNFKVSTSGKTSRKNGASLTAKILYPTGALGDNQASSQSNVAQVKVDLPKQLPSRLTTLQKACTSAQFEANPAGCPADSRVGQATAITPVLPVPVTGPAYFVSYGGAKFPELVIVLQGYGVTVYLHGETFISKAGITSSTFRHVPDVPITSFELNLPEGPFSALAANGNLCAKKLVMPTAFTGHNGATIHQNTPISVTGCPKHKAKTKAKTKGKSKSRKKK